MQLKPALEQGIALLEKGGIPSPRIAAEVLLMHALVCDRAHLYAHPERELTEVEWIHYGRYLNERLSGKPTQYITGHQEFWGLDFLVNPSVLIPRPETELIVEAALALARRHFSVSKASPEKTEKTDSSERTELFIADVGTGSGCIAVALAKELPHAHIYALDLSPQALETARQNAHRHDVEKRITFLLSDLLEPTVEIPIPQFNLLVSNPPYVSDIIIDSLMPEVRYFEPQEALLAGETGQEIYARLIPQAARAMPSGGYLVLELGYDAQEKVRSLLAAPRWEDVAWLPDLAGIIRVVTARRKP
ncbi:MAG: protein-(glutamine-N5) methyltransferase, release factor-specific [Acidobacteria bacterium RIFCSPLOWO2_02_FULL_59_13]|nr:MAG: protein-(glutamine-N5) methyltransferase, release factor-specific [Acidobacteria bacterium RIFCSPLOWO2_02_FULL_59_13]